MGEGRTHYDTFLVDPGYLANIKMIVDHIATYPGVYVMISLWEDPTFTQLGWPTTDTANAWKMLAAQFDHQPHVLFGVCNEPQHNFDGAQDAQVYGAMLESINAIRNAERGPNHLIAVQGTRAWARRLDYYVAHPIPLSNIIYETHVYDPVGEFETLFVGPSQSLPVIIGEYGPASGFMTLLETAELQRQAVAHEIPSLAWTFHMRCPPNLLQDHSAGGCGEGMPLLPTPWGTQLRAHLSN
jgi:hypothetical protein